MNLADFFANLSIKILGPNDSESLFLHWVAAHIGQLEDATEELGVELPTEGPGFYWRLRAVVLPALWRRYEHGQK